MYKVSENGCWIWQGCKNKEGYGTIKINNSSHLVHRLSYRLLVGNLHKSKLVLHKCDNPSCINPEHLVTGTHTENVRDRVRKGRSAKGLKNGRTKVDKKTAEEIKKKLALGDKKSSLALEYLVDPKTITNISNGSHWTQK